MPTQPANPITNLKRRVGAPIVNFKREAAWRNARYPLRDYLRNAPSRRMFAEQSPALDGAQQKIVQDLATNGIAISHFNDLFPDPARWNQLRAAVDEFSNSQGVQEAMQSYQSGGSRGVTKEYLVRLYAGQKPTLGLDNPWLRFGADDKVLDIVNSYLKLWTKLVGLDLWYTIPLDEERPAVQSQQWHRDHEDMNLVKVFLYFSEVDEGAGPFQYIPGSRLAGGPAHHLWRGRYYPPQEELTSRLPSSQWVTCTGSPGTLIFCDTSGFHRGGMATKRERIMGTWAYVTPASASPRLFNVNFSEEQNGLSKASRFALTHL